MPENGTLQWRVQNCEKRLDHLDEMHLDVQQERVADLDEEAKRLRTALLSFAFTIVAAAIIFALGVFRILGTGG